MKLEKLAAYFKKYRDGEYIKFERVENKLSNRPDLHAFLLLDKLVPGKSDMVSAAEHDEIWLDVEPSALAEVVTEAQILELVRCGVRYDSEVESLALFA
jgi:hypothetical protein